MVLLVGGRRVDFNFPKLLVALTTLVFFSKRISSQESCRTPVRLTGGFKIKEVWEGRRREDSSDERVRDSDSRHLDLRWEFPVGMSLQEKFLLRFRNEEDDLVRGPTLSIDDARCGYDSSCAYRIRIYPYSSFQPCMRYNISVKVKSEDFFYCTEPTERFRLFYTRTARPGPVRDLEFVNHENSFWLGTIRWRPPESESCVDHYRVSFVEDFSESGASRRRRLLEPWRWSHAETGITVHSVEHLKRCTQYRFRIRAVAANGMEGKVVTRTFRTVGCFSLAAHQPLNGQGIGVSVNNLVIVCLMGLLKWISRQRLCARQ